MSALDKSSRNAILLWGPRTAYEKSRGVHVGTPNKGLIYTCALLYCIPQGPFHFLQLGHDFYITFGAVAAYMRAPAKSK